MALCLASKSWNCNRRKSADFRYESIGARFVLRHCAAFVRYVTVTCFNLPWRPNRWKFHSATKWFPLHVAMHISRLKFSAATSVFQTKSDIRLTNHVRWTSKNWFPIAIITRFCASSRCTSRKIVFALLSLHNSVISFPFARCPVDSVRSPLP